MFTIPKPLRILIVEDDEGDFRLIRRWLAESVPGGVELQWASSYRAALPMMEGFPHHVYLVDCALGDENGLWLLREMVKNGCRAPVIILAGHSCYEVDIEAMKLGAVDFLEKPVMSGPLLERSIRYALVNKRIEAAIAKAKKEWEHTFDVVPDHIAVVDRDHRFIRVNMAMARSLHIRPKNLIGRRCYEIMHNSDSPPAACPHELMLNDGKEHSTEVYIDKLGGYFLFTVSPYYDDHSQLVGSIHVARDLTERKKAEDAVRQANEELEQRVKERTAELAARAKELEDANAALRVLLRQREEDRQDMERSVLANVRMLITPHIERLKRSRLSFDQMRVVEVVESQINQIASPLVKTISDKYVNLTVKTPR